MKADGSVPVTIRLTPRQAEQLDAARGETSRVTWLTRKIATALNAAFPVGDTLEETYSLHHKTFKGRNMARGGTPAPLEDYPSVQEMRAWVHIPLPPRHNAGSRGTGDATRGDQQASRRALEKACWMAEMENCGWPWEKIAEYWGYAEARTAQDVTNRYMAEVGAQSAERRRSQARTRTLGLYFRVIGKLDDPPPLYDTIHGRVICGPDGQPAADEAQWTRNVEMANKLETRLAAIDGSDPPSQRSDTVTGQQINTLTLTILQELASRRTPPQAIEATVLSDSDDDLEQEGQDEAAEAGGQQPAEAMSGDDVAADQSGKQQENEGDQN